MSSINAPSTVSTASWPRPNTVSDARNAAVAASASELSTRPINGSPTDLQRSAQNGTGKSGGPVGRGTLSDNTLKDLILLTQAPDTEIVTTRSPQGDHQVLLASVSSNAHGTGASVTFFDRSGVTQTYNLGIPNNRSANMMLQATAPLSDGASWHSSSRRGQTFDLAA